MNDRVLYCVGGGIAAYKAPEVVRALIAQGCEVQVLTTEAARAFVAELSLATVSRRPVRHRLFDPGEEGTIGHIELAEWAQAVLVAPATADLIARAALGLANDLVTTCLLATRAPQVWAPAMNTHMWNHPATRDNLRRLGERGATYVGPDRGELACGFVGPGRMLDPPELAAAVRRVLGRRDLEGRRVVVTAGPTRVPIDPVRFFTNASTGEMGFRLAEAAARRGAEVVLIAGPVALSTPSAVRRIDVVTARDMAAVLDRELSAAPTDLVAMVAAVADLEVAPAAGKLGKRELVATLGSARFTEAPDLLRGLSERWGSTTFLLGFAAETVPEAAADPSAVLVAAGSAKLRAKGAHAIFVNRVGIPGSGFASATNTGILLVGGEGDPLEARRWSEPVTKDVLADGILDVVRDRLGARGRP